VTVRILIIGGTAFMGRYIAESAIEAGHDVTLFNRGRTGPGLFPQATHLVGDRNVDLSALADGSWDATVDMCGYFPRQVHSLADVLAGRAGRYVFISSVSAYSSSVPRGYDENAALAEVTDPDAETITGANYGGLKVACEQAATSLFGPATTIIRPSYVIGPHDRSYRFTWWVDRLARGGQVLAPGDPSDPIQFIDARDIGRWVVFLLDQSIIGTFHAASPAPPFGFGQMLDTIAAEVAPPGTRLTWVDSDFLLAQGVDGMALPLWAEGDTGGQNLTAADPAAAYAAGLTPRPLRQTVAEMRAAGETAPPDVGLPAEREAEVVASWAAR
jgi:2'-hydroxyisoflavone reductase